MYKKESIWERWLSRLPWLKYVCYGTSPTDKELDEEAKSVIRLEIEELDSRRERLVKLLNEPERLRQKKAAIDLANELHKKLLEKRRLLAEGDSHLTEEEKAERQIWRESLTPREKCKHLKGPRVSRWGVDKYGDTFGTHKDYNVAMHRFPDFSFKIWCLNGCGFVSRPGDANWEEAKRMMGNSTNTQTASESNPDRGK